MPFALFATGAVEGPAFAVAFAHAFAVIVTLPCVASAFGFSVEAWGFSPGPHTPFAATLA
jgi:hypothetical protein